LRGKDILVSENSPPLLWILASRHSGDNTQLLALADALGWPCEVKRLAYRPYEEVLRLAGLPTLAGLDKAKSGPVAPPWPDIVLCAGRSTEAVAFWLRRNGNPKLRIVFVGTPWASPQNFDLVITTPQYSLPEASNILHNTLPLHGVTPAKLEAEAVRWEERLAQLPKPRIAVLVGGSSGPYLLRPEAAARLGREASKLASELGGSLLVTTSARTPEVAAEALAAAITVPFFFHRWKKGDEDNPFHAFLGLAERIIVTADSISMLSEASASGKPVSLFDIEEGRFSMRAEERMGAQNAIPKIAWRGRSFETTAFRLLMRYAPTRWSRDLRIVLRQTVDAGLANWLGEDPKPRIAEPADDLSRAAARIRRLFAL
jgi:mitochondrial fission protein ELM1